MGLGFGLAELCDQLPPHPEPAAPHRRSLGAPALEDSPPHPALVAGRTRATVGPSGSSAPHQGSPPPEAATEAATDTDGPSRQGAGHLTAPSPRPPRRHAALGRASRARRAMDATVSLRADRAYGSGVLITPAGLVLTVYHVIDGARHIRASLAGDPWQDAVVVETDPAADLALLRLSRPPSAGHRPAVVGSVLSAEAGDELLAVGSPHSMHFSVTRGIVSFVGRRFGELRYLQTDLPAHPGSSGGPVLDEEGRLIGLMSFVDRRGERLAFAVPVDYALVRFAEKLPPSVRHPAPTEFGRWSQALSEAPARYRAGAAPSGEAEVTLTRDQ